jgi:hypothetical protein
MMVLAPVVSSEIFCERDDEISSWNTGVADVAVYTLELGEDRPLPAIAVADEVVDKGTWLELRILVIFVSKSSVLCWCSAISSSSEMPLSLARLIASSRVALTSRSCLTVTLEERLSGIMSP